MNQLPARSYSGARSTSSAINLDFLLSTALLAAVMTLPSAVCYLFTGSTHSTGLAIASALVLAAVGLRSLTAQAFIIAALIIIAMMVHLGIALLLTSDSDEWARAFLSLAFFALMFIASFALANWLFSRPAGAINGATTLLRMAFVVVAILSILRIEPYGILPWEKAIFPFTEPSHYALIVSPLLIDICVKSRGWRRWAWLAMGYLLAYGLQSLSLAVGTTIAAIVAAPLTHLMVAGLVAPTLLAAIDLTYFLDRLDFGAQSTNVSTLVYIQGWELMIDALERSHGWGIGLQQLGYGTFHSTTAEIIFQTTRLELNLTDGGFIAAKLIGEFGIFGIAMTLAFAVIAIKSALLLRKLAFDSALAEPGRDLALAFIVGYSIDMFVRGVAYFSGSSMLFLAAIIYFVKYKPNIKTHSVRVFRPGG